MTLKESYQELNKYINENALKTANINHNRDSQIKVFLSKLDVHPNIVTRLENEYFSFGPLVNLLKNKKISEISINAFDAIYYFQNGNYYKHDDQFLSSNSYIKFVEKLLILIEKKVDEITPFTDGTWNGFRVHIISPPLSKNGFKLSLRRLSETIFPLEQYCIKKEHLSFLKQAVKTKKSMLITGETNTGKSSFLSSMLTFTDSVERNIIIEDTDEIILPNQNSLKLLTRESTESSLPNYHQDTLVKQSLRMNPDRIIVGEIRGKEAKDFVIALSTGHVGSFASIHGNSASQSLLRLETLIQMGAPNWNLLTIRRLIEQSIDSVIHLKREKEKRYVESITHIVGLEDYGFILDPIL